MTAALSVLEIVHGESYFVFGLFVALVAYDSLRPCTIMLTAHALLAFTTRGEQAVLL